MSTLSDRLDGILTRQLNLVRELRLAKSELAVVHSRVRMRLSELEGQELEADEHYRAAVVEQDPHADALRDWPERVRARIEELRAAESDLAAAEVSIDERIQRAEEDVEDFQVLQPQIVARAAAARSAGVGREVFDTLSDALNYVDMALAAAAPEDPNGPVRTTAG